MAYGLRSIGAGGRSPIWASVLALGACTVGPDYHPPRFAVSGGVSAHGVVARTASADTVGGASQRLVVGRDVAGRWWSLFRSPELTALVAEAIRSNPNLEAARQSLRNAQEQTLAQYSGLLPSVSGQFSRTRGKFPEASVGVANLDESYGFYDAQLTLSYNFDVWGGTRRAVEQRAALADAQRWLLEATYLTLAGNVVATAINEASLRAQIDAQNQLIGFEQRYLAVIGKQFALGGASGTDMALQQSAVAQAQATLVPLQIALQQARDALAADLGVAPADARLPVFTLASLQLPPDLPVSIPAALIAHRPDIRQADSNLHAATAAVGVAISNRLPQFSLNAQLGSEAVEAGQLMTPGNGLAVLLTQALQPVFSGGLLLHEQRAATATMRQEAAVWRQTVAGAFQNVADVLVALDGDSRALQFDLAAERAAARGFDLARRQYALGGTSYITVLTAEIADQADVIALARAQAQRFSDSAALFVALGGGWWNRDDLPPPPPGVLRSLLPWSGS